MQQIGSLIVFVALIAAGVFLVSEEQAAAPTSAVVVSVPFTEIAQGINANVSKRVNYLITSEEGLQELWKLLDAEGTPPTVDFSSRSVVAVFAGQQSSGGHQISVTKVEDGSSRVVAIQRVTPGAGCVVTQALTSPYQVIEVPNTELPFTHAETLVTNECN